MNWVGFLFVLATANTTTTTTLPFGGPGPWLLWPSFPGLRFCRSRFHLACIHIQYPSLSKDPPPFSSLSLSPSLSPSLPVPLRLPSFFHPSSSCGERPLKGLHLTLLPQLAGFLLLPGLVGLVWEFTPAPAKTHLLTYQRNRYIPRTGEEGSREN